MNEVSELTRERAAYMSAIGAYAALEMKILSTVAEHTRLMAQSKIEEDKATASRARLHELEMGGTGALIPAAEGVTMVAYKPSETPAAPLTFHVLPANGHDTNAAG